jgi:drug/metabolite transporter (DMT)-like permease
VILQDVIAVLGLLAASIIGAFVARAIKMNEIHWVWNIVAMVSSYGVWTLMLKHYQRPMIFMSTLYDVSIIVFWTITLSFLGEQISLLNALGVALAIVGVILIAL